MKIDSIFIYPVKSLSGVEVISSKFTDKGALQNDRRFAFFNAEGKAINGKREPRLYLLEQQIIPDNNQFIIDLNGNKFDLDEENEALNLFMTDYLGYEAKLRESDNGFPDDDLNHGPTIVSKQTLNTVAEWFNETRADVLKRFRPNIIVNAGSSFFEDTLLDTIIKSKTCELLISNHCNRCIVPTRNLKDGIPISDFKTHFVAKRAKTLPEEANKYFNHMYKLCMNTMVQNAGNGIVKNNSFTII